MKRTLGTLVLLSALGGCQSMQPETYVACPYCGHPTTVPATNTTTVKAPSQGWPSLVPNSGMVQNTTPAAGTCCSAGTCYHPPTSYRYPTQGVTTTVASARPIPVESSGIVRASYASRVKTDDLGTTPPIVEKKSASCEDGPSLKHEDKAAATPRNCRPRSPTTARH